MKLRIFLAISVIIASIATMSEHTFAQSNPASIANSGSIAANGQKVGIGADFGTPSLNGQNCSADVSGTWTGTLTFKIAQQSDTFYTADTYVTTNPSTTTSNGLFAISAAGATSIEVIATAAWTGTANVTIYCTAGGPIHVG